MEARRPLAVVTPTLDGDVLTRLALADVPFTPGQLQRLLPDASVDGVRRVLNRLANQGIVTSTRIGSAAITYALNREHLAAEPIIALANQASTLRERIEVRLGEWEHPPDYAALFGSWARGTAITESDVDLFLLRPYRVTDEAWGEQVGSLEEAVSRWTGNDARCLVMNARDLPRLRDEPVLRSIMREGLTLYGDAATFRRAIKTGVRAYGKLIKGAIQNANDEG